MSESVIREYCRLITADTDACLALFHDEAILVTRIGNEPLEVSGHEKIRAFLDMTPRFLKYELKTLREENGFQVASIHIEGAHRAMDQYRFFIDEGSIRRLEISKASAVS